MTSCSKCLENQCGESHVHNLTLTARWDVVQARQIVADGRPAYPVERDSLEKLAGISRVSILHLSHVDPAIPGIVGWIVWTDLYGTVHRQNTLFDGKHRAARCFQEGVPFACYLLTEEESAACLLPAG